MAKKDQVKEVQVEVNSGTVIGSQYAQIVGVSVTDYEVTLDFIYVSPQVKTKGQTVARVTMPIEIAQQASSLITDTIKRHNASTKK